MSLNSSDILFYSGIMIMIFAVIIALACFVIFRISGKKLKKTLEQEYGTDAQNNSRNL